MMRWDSINQLNQAAAQEAVQGGIFVQLTDRFEKLTKSGKPYLELQFADTTGMFSLKVWDNAPWFADCAALASDAALELCGCWSLSAYGLELAALEMRPLSPDELNLLLQGSADDLARQQADWDAICSMVASMRDPRLRLLCEELMAVFGARFRRAAAARSYHHARRGGLVEHSAGMMRAAKAICTVYADVNEDLLLAGALFHDSGKMWENCYPEQGLSMDYSLPGELLGHIPMGIEIINSLWKRVYTPERKAEWSLCVPSSESMRLHLLHMVAAHHGELQFGSPVPPKTPEAMLLNRLDDMDAKMEMFRLAYQSSPELAQGIQQRRMLLPGNVVAPLPSFEI